MAWLLANANYTGCVAGISTFLPARWSNKGVDGNVIAVSEDRIPVVTAVHGKSRYCKAREVAIEGCEVSSDVKGL